MARCCGFRVLAVLLGIVLVGMAGGTAWATPSPIYLDANGLALGGFDLLAYFNEGVARRGSPQFEAEYKGARFRFATQANKQTFEEDPDRYLPAFQGHCAYAMAAGKKRKCDPRRFSVKDGKLLLFSSERARQRWNRDEATLFSKAIAYWRELIH